MKNTQQSHLFQKTVLALAISVFPLNAMATTYSTVTGTSPSPGFILYSGDIINTLDPLVNSVQAGSGQFVTGTTGGLTITSTGGGGIYGVYANGGGSISLTGSDSAPRSTINYSGNGAGFGVMNTGSTVTASYFDVTVYNNGLGANANGGTINIDHSTFDVRGINDGFNADNGGTLNASDITLTRGGGSGGHGVRTGFGGGGGTVVLLGTANTISTVSDNVHGVYAQGGAVWLGVDPAAPTVAMATTTVIKTDGASADGINVSKFGTTTPTVTGANVAIATTGISANGINVTNSGLITFVTGGTNSISTTGGSANGINVTGGTITFVTGSTNSISTTGGSANGISVDSTGVVTLNDIFKIKTTGNDANGVLINSGGDVSFNDIHSLGDTDGISTIGSNAHGIRLQGGANKTFNGDAGNILPNVQVSGNGSAVLDVADATLTLAGSTALSMGMTLNLDAWGVKSEGTSTATFSENSSTGGTGLWGLGIGKILFTDTADAGGSRVKLDDSSVLDIRGTTNSGVKIGSLEGASTAAQVLLGSKSLTIGAGTGSLLPDATYAGVIGDATTTGNLIKTGTTKQRLTGTGSQVGSVDVTVGTLSFEQDGGFTVGTNYTTQSGGITALAATSQLNVANNFQQAAGSTLNVTLGTMQPMITANTANLDGTLNVTGFSGSTFTNATDLTNPAYYFTLIHTTNGITGDFTNNPLIPGSSIDYLVERGYVSPDSRDYNLGFLMAWTNGGQALGTGDFTLNTGENFNVNVALADQVGPFDSGWDGTSLTKKGAGLLTLSVANTYTGTTDIQAGTLQTTFPNAFAQSSAVTVDGTLDLNNNDQTANNLSGASTGVITLGSATLTANNSADTAFAGVINGTGGLTKMGAGKLTLTGTGSSIANIMVNGGTLEIGDPIRSPITFTTTGDYTTQTGGTHVGLGSTLNVGGSYSAQNGTTTFLSAGGILNATSAVTLASGATLKVILANRNPEIIADSADIMDATFHMVGFGGTATTYASTLPSSTYTVIRTASGISGDFSNSPLKNTAPDYLIKSGSILGKDYILSFKMAWTDGGQIYSTGSFTMDTDTTFNVDVPLADQVGTFNSGWDGKSLTKSGDGILTLSVANGYTGDTTVQGGTLIVSAAPTSGDTTAYGGVLSVASGATLETSAANIFNNAQNVTVDGNWTLQNGFTQTANNLSGGATGLIDLGTADLTTNNTQDTVYHGGVTGAGNFIKTGSGMLTLTGALGWTGETQLNAGVLTLDGSNGGAQLVSDIIGQAGTTLNLNNGATLTGTIDPTNVTIDAASTWNMTGDSIVDNLSNAGVITFINTTNTGNTLTVNGDYVGQNGLINLNTVLADDNAITDKLLVTGSTSGATRLAVTNIHGAGAQTTNGIELVHVGGASNGTFSLTGRAVAGSYEYYLFQGTPTGGDGNWYLRSQDTNGTPEPVLRPESGAYLSNQYAANTLFLNTLHDRLGEPQYANDVRGQGNSRVSSWGRISGGHTNSHVDGGQISQSVDSYMAQVGTDLIYWNTDNSRIYAGLMFSAGNAKDSAKANNNSADATGKVTGYATGIYGTWYNNRNDALNTGLYVDSWLQYGRYENKVSSTALNDVHYDSHNWIGSLEAGYGIALSVSDPNSQWYLEPQVQMIYTDYSQDDFMESNGTKVSSQDTNGWTSRIGARLYGHQTFHGNDKIQPFVAINWWHDQNNSAIRMDNDIVKQGIPSNRIEAKIGLQLEIAQSWDLYSNVDLQMGSNGYENYQAQAGVKYFW